jgi:hypothetical protein
VTAAQDLGYYEVPRRTNLRKLAAHLKMSKSTVASISDGPRSTFSTSAFQLVFSKLYLRCAATRARMRDRVREGGSN